MLTIFTPTYNRGYIIERLYNSLLHQTNYNFEWLIVDDGSTDDTKSLIEQWINEKKINIRYYYQENQGKPIAHNLGVENAKGDIFVCVDSDDYLTEDAVDIIITEYEKIKNLQQCTGIVGVCVTKEGKPVGNNMPTIIQYSTLYDLYNKYKYKGDTILVYKLQIIRKYRFPKINGEKFIPETYLYDKIDSDGKLKIINDGIYVCEYLEDGYTNNSAKLIKNNPKGYIMCAKQRMEIAKTFYTRLKACAQYVLGNWLNGSNNFIKDSPKKFTTILSIPFAMYMYIKKYSKNN